MANTTISPNMNLPVPTVGQDPGPDWATNIDSCLGAIDSHNHSTGQGVLIQPSGLNINADLPFSGNNATTMRSVNFNNQGSPLATAVDLGCIYVSGGEFFYNDESGNHVQLTSGGSPAGGSGTITGLSAPASASFAAGTFTFKTTATIPASMRIGPIITGAAVASPKTVTISASASQPANYNLTWPLALPGSTSFVNLDSSGNMGSVAATGTGNVVLDTSPTVTSATVVTPVFSGNSTGTIIGTTFSPTVTFSGAPAIAGSNFWYTRNGEIVQMNGFMDVTPGSPMTLNSVTIPIATTTLIISGSISVINSPFPGAAEAFLVSNSGNTLVVSPATITLGAVRHLISFSISYAIN